MRHDAEHAHKMFCGVWDAAGDPLREKIHFLIKSFIAIGKENPREVLESAASDRESAEFSLAIVADAFVRQAIRDLDREISSN